MGRNNFVDSLQLLSVSVVIGFLGRGKKTVFNHLIQQGALSRTLVVINEFWGISLEHDLVTFSGDDAVIEVASGCLCCTFRSDLTKIWCEAPKRFARGEELCFDPVVIETTGLAELVSILHILLSYSRVAQQYRLDSVITKVDAVNGESTPNRQVELVKQSAMADKLLITKSDLFDDYLKLRELQKRLRTLHPAAPQIVVENGAPDQGASFDASLYNSKSKAVDAQSWLKVEAQAEPHGHDHHQYNGFNRHDAHINAVCHIIDEPIYSEALNLWFETLFQSRAANFPRTTGIIYVVERDGLVVVHGVQHIFRPAVMLDEWPSDGRRSRIVFITRNINATDLSDTLRVVTGVRARQPERQAASSVAPDISGFGIQT